jgi:hypothetical protein
VQVAEQVAMMVLVKVVLALAAAMLQQHLL